MATTGDYLPGKLNFPAVLNGDTFPAFSITGVTVNGSAPTSNLSSVRIDFRTSPTATTASKSLSSGAGDITIDDAAAWAFTIEEFTNDLAAGTYCQDIETTAVDGTIRTYSAGIFVSGQDVTRT